VGEGWHREIKSERGGAQTCGFNKGEREKSRRKAWQRGDSDLALAGLVLPRNNKIGEEKGGHLEEDPKLRIQALLAVRREGGVGQTWIRVRAGKDEVCECVVLGKKRKGQTTTKRKSNNG